MDGLEGEKMTRRASAENVLDLYIRTRLTIHIRIDRDCDEHVLLNLHAVQCHKVKKHHFSRIAACMYTCLKDV